MKIAYILDLFPVISETFIVREIFELKRNGLEVSIFSLRDTKGTEFSKVIHADSEALIPNVVYLPSLLKWGKAQLFFYHLYFFVLRPISYIRTLLFSCRHSKNTFLRFKQSVLLAMELKRSGVEHLHAHFALDACKLSMLTSVLAGIPYSFTMHAHDIFRPDLSDLIEDKFKNAKFIASISNYNKNFILNKYPSIDSDKIKIVHCGIKIRNAQPHSNKSSKSFTIITVGRLVEQKGLKFLIQACNILKRNHDIKFICNIIGEGKEKHQLENMIARFELNDVIYLLGVKDQKEVIEALESANVFVLPCTVEKNSAMDGIPVALMEAMAMELPVISTSISGIPELIKDGAGILVEPENAKQLSEAILRVYNLNDRDLKEMTMKGKSIVMEEFSLTSEVKKLVRLFRS